MKPDRIPAGGVGNRHLQIERDAAWDVSPLNSSEPNPWHRWQSLLLETGPDQHHSSRLYLEEKIEPRRRIITSRSVTEFPDGEVHRIRSSSVLEPRTGHTLEHYRQYRNEHRRYVIRPGGYTVETLMPGERTGAGRAGLRLLTRREFSTPLLGKGRIPSPIFDFQGMLQQLHHAVPLLAGDALEYWIATTSGPRPCRLMVTGTDRRRRTIQDPDRPTYHTLDVDELHLHLSHFDSDCSDEVYCRMGGDIEIVLEASSMTLLEIRGKIPGMNGHTELRVTAIS